MPSVSIVLMSFNQEDYIREAVKSLFAQDYAPLEILISDDCSTDSTYDILKEEVSSYSGPHEIRLHRNSENLRGAHLDAAVRRALGEFLVIAHGDDIAKPNRVRRLVETWRKHNVSLVSSNAEVIDGRNNLLGIFSDANESTKVDLKSIIVGWDRQYLGATMGCHRDIFTAYEAMSDQRAGDAYDCHILPFRAQLLNGVYYLNETLLRYRRHGDNWGDRLADRTQSPLIAAEGFAALRLMSESFMLEDLDYRISKTENSERLNGIRDHLNNKITATIRNWVKQRNELIRSGKRPTWVARSFLDQRPLNPDLVFQSTELAEFIALLDKDDPQAIENMMQDRINTGHNVGPYHFYYAHTLSKKGDRTGAIREVEKALLLDPEKADYKALLGRLYLRESKFSHAERLLSEAISLKPHVAAPHYHLALTFEHKQRFGDALREAELAVNFDSLKVEYKSLLGKLYLREGKLDRAAESLSDAIALNPHASNPHHFLALTYERQNRFDDALYEAEQAIKIDPEKPHFLVLASRLYFQRGELNSAETKIRLALIFMPEAANYHHLLSLILQKKESIDDAVTEIKRAIDLDNSNQQYPLLLKSLLSEKSDH